LNVFNIGLHDFLVITYIVIQSGKHIAKHKLVCLGKFH